MILDEAIKHYEEKAKELKEKAESNIIEITKEGVIRVYDGKEYVDCIECAEEHEQLAEWLKELKALKERQQGEWVKDYKGQVNSFCSKCDYEVGKKTKFCPNCGADMRKGGAE